MPLSWIEKDINFDLFIGIDWSGAENPGKGLQVAQCSQGTTVPQIFPINGGGNWRRKEIIDWLAELHHAGQRILVGFDFAFAYPYCDKHAYFPEHNRTPKKADLLWKLIDSICNPGDFYGAPFYKPPPFCDYLLYQTYRGEHYNGRMRITDNHCKKNGGNPASVFKCVGQGSVGIGSIAGMRMLHHIKTHLNGDFQIWPFERENNGRSVIVEIYPALFYKLASKNSKNWQIHEIENNVLKYFFSDPLPSDLMVKSQDQNDAIISSAAIRHLSNNPNTWQPAELNKCARDFEGWIFGVV